MRRYISILFLIVTNIIFGQTFTYSGYIYNAGGGGAPNVPVKLYKRTTPNLVGFTSQTNYNGHSYYRSTSSSTWTSAKTTCESMNGHLATVSNAAENNFLFNTWPSGWIGYYQDRVAGYTYSEPAGGYRWTESQVVNGLSADYDVSSYSSGTVLTDIRSSINATLYNTPTYSSTGGKYLAFNGSNQYAITNNLASKFTNTSISVVAWIFPTGNGVIASELGVASTSSGWHESIMEITGSNTLRVGFWSGTGIVQLSTSITLNTWNLVCITYDGTTMRGYLNNVNFGSTNFTRQAAFLHGGTGQQHFAFGLQDATNMGHGGFGSFRLGLIQFFNRAITVDEIDRTFNLYAYRYRTNQYTNWNPGEPNNSSNEDYTQFVGGGRWNDLVNTSLPYVIEFDYIVGFTPWVLHQTVYTNSSGYYSFSQSTNPSTEWYIQIDIPTTVTTISNNDAVFANNKVISRTFNSLDYYRYDVNNDGLITISDVYYIYMKKSGRFSTWGGSLPNTRLFTQSQYNIINSSTSDLRSTYPGTSSITISTPTSGGSSSYYLINTGYSNSSILSY
jgi:hypothetical protein